MPVYEYVCRKCGEKIAEVLTIKEHETKKVAVSEMSKHRGGQDYRTLLCQDVQEKLTIAGNVARSAVASPGSRVRSHELLAGTPHVLVADLPTLCGSQNSMAARAGDL